MMPPGWQEDVRRVVLLSRLARPGMGDLVQRNIFLNLLRGVFAQARLTWVAAQCVTRFSHQEEFVRHHSYAHEVVLCPDPEDADPMNWGLFLDWLAVARFDACVVDPSSTDLGVRDALGAGIGIRAAVPLGVTDDALITHPMRLPRPLLGGSDLYDFAAALARALEVTAPRPGQVVPRLPIQPEDLPAWVGRRPFVGLHPTGAKGWNRRWPLASYAELAVRLIDTYDPTVLILGAADEFAEISWLRGAILRERPAAEIHIRLGEPLNRAANLIDAMDLLIGNDSGPAHLAAALATRTVVIYGPTGTEALWARVYPGHRGVNKGYPCQRLRHDPTGDIGQCEHACPCYYVAPQGPYPKCLTDISVAEVWRAVRAQLRAIGAPAAPPASVPPSRAGSRE